MSDVIVFKDTWTPAKCVHCGAAHFDWRLTEDGWLCLKCDAVTAVGELVNHEEG